MWILELKLPWLRLRAGSRPFWGHARRARVRAPDRAVQQRRRQFRLGPQVSHQARPNALIAPVSLGGDRPSSLSRTRPATDVRRCLTASSSTARPRVSYRNRNAEKGRGRAIGHRSAQSGGASLEPRARESTPWRIIVGTGCPMQSQCGRGNPVWACIQNSTQPNDSNLL